MYYDTDTLELNKVLAILATYAKTKYAKEKIITLKPVSEFDKVKKISLETKEAYEAIIKLSDIPLGGLYEVIGSIKRAEAGGILEPNELLNIVGLIQCTTKVIQYFKSLEGIKVNTPNLSEYVKDFKILTTLKSSITLAINDLAEVMDNASRELFTIRRSITSLENRLRSKLNEILTTKGSMLTESLIVLRNNRMCLPVKIEYKNTFKGIVHDISSSQTTCYIEPESTIETSNQIESYKAMEKKEILNILRNLSLLVSADAEDLLINLERLTDLDVIFAKALMAKDKDYNEVNITCDHNFSLKKACHPLIPKNEVVPIDVELSKHQVIIITGPNTGGKTVALKTVGILHAMMMCGMMLPCSRDSSLSVYENVLVDIGDEQSIEQSLSTFSAHITKMKHILELVSFDSLCLLDELGSGTDPKEGSCLAIAMIDYIKKRGAKLLVTTHYSDLKAYAYQTEGILNASVEFSMITLKPTYRLLVGIPGKSNAIEIAKRIGLPEQIINDSKIYMETANNTEGKALIDNLEEEMLKNRAHEEELLHKIAMYDSLNQKLSSQKQQLIKQTDQIKAQAKEEALKIISDAKEEANKLLAELKKMLSDSSYKEHELATLKHNLNELNVKDVDEQVFDEELNVGDYVYIKTYEKNGTIEKIKKNRYTVRFGQFAMDFAKNDLIKAIKPKEKLVKQTRLSGYNPASHVTASLDLRGKRYEEINDLLDQYIDQAILGNLEQVSIIHGFGTGTVRNAVQKYLKNNSYVKSYRYGGEGEGLNGVTIVRLK